MLNQGFYEEVTRILDQLPEGPAGAALLGHGARRTSSTSSASTPPTPETLLLSGDVFTVEHIHHVRYDVTDAYPKPRNLIYLLEMEEPDNAIVFCNTRDDTALVTAVLNRNGFDAELLNGDLPQKERERVMAKVKRGEVAFMVATDIAARGIDISRPALRHQLLAARGPGGLPAPRRPHRPHREEGHGDQPHLRARAGARFTALEKKYGIKFEKREMPSPEEAMRMWTERHVAGDPASRRGQRLRGVPRAGRRAEAAPGRRRRHRLSAQVLLRAPADGEAEGGRGRAAGAGARAATARPGAFPGRPATARRARRARRPSRAARTLGSRRARRGPARAS